MKTIALLLILAAAGLAQSDAWFDEPWLAGKPGANVSSLHSSLSSGPVLAESIHSYNVRHYRLDINLPMTNRSYVAHEALSIRSDISAVLVCTLNFVNLVCDSAKRSGLPLNFTTPTGLLAVELDNPLPLRDSTVLDIFYHRESTAVERGYFFAKAPSVTHTYCMTCTPPEDARYWMPCWDEPFDKPERGVMLNITVPDTFQVCANGLLDSVTTGSGTKTFWWNHPYPIATYLINFAASRFASWHHDLIQPNGDTVPCLYFMWPADSAVSVSTFGRIPAIFDFYSDTTMFGPYPFEKYGQVPGYYSFPWGAMENQTLTMINTQWLRNGDDNGMAHELSHMWYGDMVTCVDFANIWLNEGFATYFECLYAGHAGGRSVFNNYIGGKGRSAIQQDRSNRFPLFNPPESEIYNYGTIYCKGAWVEHTLRWVLGDTAWEQPGVFFKALRAYGDSFKYGCASTDDYCRINERESGRELSWFFNEWVYQAGYPKYHLNWNNEAVGDSFRVITSLGQANGSGAPDFFRTPLPVRLNCPSADTVVAILPEANPQVDTFVVAVCPDSITVDPDNWVLDSSFVTGIEEMPNASLRATNVGPTIVRGVLNLQSAICNLQSAIVLMDASGRKVLALRTGPNDVSHLAPGVYFVHSTVGTRHASMSRVVVTR
jgi:aminopeptidase N